MDNVYQLTINSKQKKILTLVCVFGFLSFFFSLLMIHNFAYHNDYRIWEYANQRWGSVYPEFYHLFAYGRPIGALLLNILLMFAKGFHSLVYYQLFSSTIIIAAAVFFCYFLLTYLNISYFSAALLTILMFTLPSMTLNAFWITNLVPCVIPLFIIIGTQMLILDDFKKHLALIVFLLIISILIYPPATFFYITITFLKLAFPPKNSQLINIQFIFKETMLLFSVAISVFLFIKFLLKPLLIHTQYLNYDWSHFYFELENHFPPQYSLAIHFNLGRKLSQIFQLINLVLDGWFRAFKPFPYLLIAAPISLYIGNLMAKKSIYFRKITKYPPQVVLLGLFFFSAFPLLVSSYKYQVNFRISFATAAFLPILLVYYYEHFIKPDFLKNNHNLIMVSISVMLVFVAQACSLNRLILTAERSSDEFKQVYSILEHNIQADTKTIVMLQPLFNPPKSKLLTTDYALNGTDVGIPGIIRIALLEQGKNPDNYQISFIQNLKMIPKEEHQLLILPSMVRN